MEMVHMFSFASINVSLVFSFWVGAFTHALSPFFFSQWQNGNWGNWNAQSNRREGETMLIEAV